VELVGKMMLQCQRADPFIDRVRTVDLQLTEMAAAVVDNFQQLAVVFPGCASGRGGYGL